MATSDGADPWSMQDLSGAGLDRLQWDGVVNGWDHVIEMCEAERVRRKQR